MGAFSSRTSEPTEQPNLSGRVLLVTGANRGIGFETAKQLYKLGGTVYLGARSEENARQAIELIQAHVKGGEGQLRWLPLDLSTVAKARESAEGFLKLEDRLDILVNNACLGDAPFEVNEDGVEIMMGINHIGHYVLTTTLLDLINHIGHYVLTTTLLDLMKRTSTEKGADVRIVNVASLVHNAWGRKTQISFTEPSDMSQPFPAKDPDTWSHTITRYSRTKLANLLFTKELQRRLDKDSSGIIALSVHPGYVATEAVKESTAKMPFLGMFSTILVKLFLMDEAAGARNSVFAASNPTVRSERDKYKGTFLTPVGKVSLPSVLAQDPNLAKDLWTLTEKIVCQRLNP